MNPTSRALFDLMDRWVTAYEPTRIVRPCDRIRGTAFFPGGDGLWDPTGAFPRAPVFILGHNFDSVEAFKCSLKRGAEDVDGNATWSELLRWLDHAGVNRADCFFTNALMGIKVGESAGPLCAPPPYRQQCRSFLAEQLRLTQPSAIVTLGSEAPKVLKSLSPVLREAWRTPGKSFSLDAIDRRGAHVVRDVSIHGRTYGPEGIDFVVRCPVIVALTHPSYWAPRRADAEMLREALRHVVR